MKQAFTPYSYKLSLLKNCLLTLCLFGHASACASQIALHPNHGIEQQTSCPASYHDYGSGMIAFSLSTESTKFIEKIHDRLIRQVANHYQQFQGDANFNPHISLLYGVNAENSVDHQKTLQHLDANSTSQKLHISHLIYWPHHHQIVVAAAIEDTSHTLQSIHQQFQNNNHQQERHAYTPHITLAYMPENFSLSKEEEQSIVQQLQSQTIDTTAIFITNHCGQLQYNKITIQDKVIR